MPSYLLHLFGKSISELRAEFSGFVFGDKSFQLKKEKNRRDQKRKMPPEAAKLGETISSISKKVVLLM